LVVAFVVDFEQIRVGVAGRNKPAEEGGGGLKGRRQGGDFLQIMSITVD
jgi:hypothetical protein